MPEAAEKTGTIETTMPSGFVLHRNFLTVIMRAGKAKITHTFKRPTLNNWTDYLNDLKAGFILNEAKGWAATNDEAFAAKSLWGNIITTVTGYKGAGGNNWKDKIPVAHKKIGINFLQDVWVEDMTRADANDEKGNPVFDLDADSRTVVLAATSDGFRFDRLVHILSVPSAEQQIRFDRTRIHYIRQTGESNRVISPPRLRKMTELYDELIRSVEGYVVEEVTEAGVGKEPGTKLVPVIDKVEARKYMDCLHKQAAVLAVFNENPVGERVGADAGGAQAAEVED